MSFLKAQRSRRATSEWREEVLRRCVFSRTPSRVPPPGTRPHIVAALRLAPEGGKGFGLSVGKDSRPGQYIDQGLMPDGKFLEAVLSFLGKTRVGELKSGVPRERGG